MSLLKRSAVTLTFQLGGQAVTVLAGIALARSLGPAGKGVTAYAMVALALVTTYFSGQNQAIAYQFGRKRLGLHAVHRAMLHVFAMVAPFCVIIMAAIGWGFSSQRALIAAAIALPFALYTQFCAQFFLVIGRPMLSNLQGFGSTVLYGIGVLAFVLLGHGGTIAALSVWVASIVIGTAYSSYHILPYLQGRREYRRDQAEAAEPLLDEATLPHPEVVRDHLAFSYKSGLASLASYLNLRIDVFLVSVMLGAAELGTYTLAIATGELMWRVAQAVIWSALGRIASEPRERAAQLVAKLARNIFAFQLVAGTIAFVFAPPLITAIYGQAFAEAATALRFLLPGLMLYTVDGMMGYFFSVQEGKPTLRLAVQCSSIVVCALITVLTIHRFSIVGAAIATSVSYIGVVAVMTFLFTRATGVSVGELFLLQRSDIERYAGVIKNAVGHWL
jgi:O-antigen/teichoic acid export membrane protein